MINVSSDPSGDDPSWNASYNGIFRNIPCDHTVRSDGDIIADGNISDDFCTRPNVHTIAYGGKPLVFSTVCPSNSNALADVHIVTDDRLFTDNDVSEMTDIETFP